MQIARLTATLETVAAAVDAILRGQHNGWDQALAKLRNDLSAIRNLTGLI